MNRFARTDLPDQALRRSTLRAIAFVQIEIIRRRFICLEHDQVLAPKMPIALSRRYRRIEERQIGVVAAQQPRAPQVECLVAGDDRQIGIQRVVGFANERCFVVSEDLRDVRSGSLEPEPVAPAVEDDCEGELTEVFACVLIGRVFRSTLRHR